MIFPSTFNLLYLNLSNLSLPPPLFPLLLLHPGVLSAAVVERVEMRQRAGWLRRRCLPAGPRGTLAVPHHVLLIPAL